MKRIVLISIVVLFALTALSFTAGKSVILKLKPTQGKTHTVITKTNTTTTMTALGETGTIYQNDESREVFTIKEVTNEHTIIDAQLDAHKMTATQSGRTFIYDSEHPEKTSSMIDKQLTQTINNDIKKVITLTYNHTGQLIDGNDALSIYQLGAAIPKLPSHELKVGSTWSSPRSHSEKYGKEYYVDMTFTVTAITKKHVDYSYIGTINSPKNEVNGTYEGTCSVDPQTGLYIKWTQKQIISLTASFEGYDIPTTIVGNTTVTVK